VHRDHRDRSIVITKIGIVISRIGLVITRIGIVITPIGHRDHGVIGPRPRAAGAGR